MADKKILATWGGTLEELPAFLEQWGFTDEESLQALGCVNPPTPSLPRENPRRKGNCEVYEDGCSPSGTSNDGVRTCVTCTWEDDSGERSQTRCGRCSHRSTQ